MTLPWGQNILAREDQFHILAVPDMVAAAGSQTKSSRSDSPAWKNVMITGGAGFIGSHLVRRLLAEPKTERAVIFDNFSSGQFSYLNDSTGDPRLEVVQADLKDPDAVSAAMAGCDTIFHLAANPDIARAVTEPGIDFW
ncbi:MAG TPA: NAD-dependent epimerase/dehydratase family protein, partial [Chthoniobacterales bacterium]